MQRTEQRRNAHSTEHRQFRTDIRRTFHASGPLKATKPIALHKLLPKEEGDGTNQGPATQTKRQWNSILGQTAEKQRCSDKWVWIGAMWLEVYCIM